MLSIFCLSACSSEHQGEVDELNLKAYTFHYRHLDSVEHYARKAYQLATHYSAGRAEALNHLAFIQIARMDFDRAYELLDSIDTDNQVELLIADVQRMRLCQRQSNNRDFYIHRERAIQRLRRIDEDRSQLSPHLQRRVEYATSEMNIGWSPEWSQ